MDRLVERVLKAQTQLVADLKDVAGLVSGQVTSLEERAKSQSDAMVATFTGQTEAMVKAFTESMQTLQRTTGDTLADNVQKLSQRALDVTGETVYSLVDELRRR